MEVDTIAKLAELKYINALKESTGSVDDLSQLKMKLPEDFSIYSGDDFMTFTPNSDAFIFMRWVKNPQSISYVKRRDIRKLKHVFDLDVKTLAHLLGVDSDKMFRWLKPCKNGDDYIPIKRSDLSRVFKDLASHIPNSDKETLRKKAEAFDCENGLTKA